MKIEKDWHLKTEHPPTMLEAEALIKEIEGILDENGDSALDYVLQCHDKIIIRIYRTLCEMRMHILDMDNKNGTKRT